LARAAVTLETERIKGPILDVYDDDDDDDNEIRCHNSQCSVHRELGSDQKKQFILELRKANKVLAKQAQ